MPRSAVDSVHAYADTWMTRGVRAWSEGWWEMGRTVGDLLAPIIGAAPGSISMHQNASVAQGIIGSCFRYDGPRRKIVLTSLEFPTNIYLFEGFRRYGADVVIVPGQDEIRTNLERLLAAIDEHTILVPLSLVLFRSSYIQDARAVIEKAHRVGAHVILDIYQAAGRDPDRSPGAGGGFRGRRIGEVAVWRPGRRLSLRAAGPGADAPAGIRGLGRPCRTVCLRSGADSICRRPRAVPERNAERPGARIRRGPATRSWRASASRLSAPDRSASPGA